MLMIKIYMKEIMMKSIILPVDYNYIGVFLTLRCNLNCDYCINKQSKLIVREELSGRDWIKGLSRIRTRSDLPITLQGGEPTLHKDFYAIAGYFEDTKHFDLLTNGSFDVDEFINWIMPDLFNRQAKYANIRFSYHKNMNATALAIKVWNLQKEGYSVGVWGLSNNDNREIKSLCAGLNIDFRVKEYLDKSHGTYKYPEGLSNKLKRVLCKPSELLIAPDGLIYRCHSDLYAARNPIGYILDKEIKFPDYLLCDYFGDCNPCDLKLKTNRFQEYGHCSVEIKEIK